MPESKKSLFLCCSRLLSRLVKHFQWSERKYREQQQLLNCEEYLLRDMGLRRFEGRFEAVDASRIERQRTEHEESEVLQAEPSQKATA